MDEDELFCMSLVGTFKHLPPQKKELAKISVQSLLYELQYGSPQPAPLLTLPQHAPMMASQNFQQHQPGPCMPNEGGEFTALLSPPQEPQGEKGMAFLQQPSYGFLFLDCMRLFVTCLFCGLLSYCYLLHVFIFD